MLRSRIIPCLLVHDEGLNKTECFNKGKYVGDPLNAVKIFNEKQVDEIVILDIDKTVESKDPDFKLIESLANESRMPLCYGGGIKTVNQALKIVSLGVEKIALSSAMLDNLNLSNEIAKFIGKQSVVLALDVKKNFFGNDYNVYTHNGKNKFSKTLIEILKELKKYQIGEVLLNSIDRDGKMNGYDYNLVDLAKKYLDVPLTVIGGASDYNDLKELIKRYKIIGAAAGSLFVFNGRFKAVLINYPNRNERLKIYNETNYSRS